MANSEPPSFAFAFDIDGVLLHQCRPIPGAAETLAYLHEANIPFILLTNGGGKHERERVADLNKRLDPKLTIDNFVQSHTPFQDLAKGLEDKVVLVTGADPEKCREIAEEYGFKKVITSADILAAHPNIWPFDHKLQGEALARVRPLPKPVKTDAIPDEEALKVDAIFVFNDPRDWALDIQIITDLLLSRQGILATKSPRNGDPTLPNHGWQTDGQPTLYFSHGDIFWATQYHLPRLAQGSFAACLAGLWSHITGGVPLRKRMLGKPHNDTYAYAERVLNAHRAAMISKAASAPSDDEITEEKPKVKAIPPLKTVYMVGDNPESDIRGANEYRSPLGTDWYSILVRTGVWSPGPRKEDHVPRVTVDDVKAAVEWALEREGRPARIGVR